MGGSLRLLQGRHSYPGLAIAPSAFEQQGNEARVGCINGPGGQLSCMAERLHYSQVGEPELLDTIDDEWLRASLPDDGKRQPVKRTSEPRCACVQVCELEPPYSVAGKAGLLLMARSRMLIQHSTLRKGRLT